MVNTVGSFETKYWHGSLIPFKQALTISSEQRSLLIGSLLGDGTMWLGKNGRNVNYKVEHGLEQKEYVFWKYKILKSLVLTEPKLSYRYNASREKYPKSWWFRTVRHPLLTEIYDLWYTGNGYRGGKKIVPKTVGDVLTPLALAVWIMDDGSYAKGTITISTYSFDLFEINMLQRVISEKYGIRFLVYPDRDKGFRMHTNQKEARSLINIITPYIIPSMLYKIGFKTP